MKHIATAVVSILFAAHAQAGLLIYEGFDYGVGSITGQVATGTGLTGSWAFTDEAGSTAEVVGSGLSVPGHFAGTGGALRLADTGGPWGEKMLGAEIGTSLVGNPVLFGSSVMMTESPDGNFWDDWVMEQRIHSGATSGWAGDNVNGPGLRMLNRAYGSGTSADGRGGVGANFSEAAEGAGAGTITPAEPWLMVSRFDVDGAGVTTGGSIWFFNSADHASLQAALQGGAPLTEATLGTHSYLTLTDGDGGYDLNGSNYLQFVIQGGPVGSFDEVRIGTTLADVVNVIPEPSSLALLLCGAWVLIRRRREG